MTTPAVARVGITPEAAVVLRRLRAQHGPLMFHQSGGCCDGSAPMCFPTSEFIVGDADVLLGVLRDGDAETPVWISGSQFELWKHTQLLLDVVAGRGAGSGVEGPKGGRSRPAARGSNRRSRRGWKAALLLRAVAISPAAKPLLLKLPGEVLRDDQVVADQLVDRRAG